MRIIPVLDIQNSQVVHGVKGERNKYVPVTSVLTSSTKPIEVAQTFKKHFSIAEMYIADIDAILSRNSKFSYLRELIQISGLQIMLDAGVYKVQTALNLLNRGINKIIIGTETLRSIQNLKEILSVMDPEKLIVSLDLKMGKIISTANELMSITPQAAIQLFEDLGILELIILELTKVGSESGVMTEILHEILQRSSLKIITGGGARNIQDLQSLKDAGVSGVLIATALHNGAITAQDLESL